MNEDGTPPDRQPPSSELQKLTQGLSKRWNIVWDDATALTQFRNRVLFLVDKYLGPDVVLTTRGINRYAYYSGQPAPFATVSHGYDQINLKNSGLHGTVVFNTIQSAATPQSLAFYLGALFAVLKEALAESPSRRVHGEIAGFFAELDEAMAASPSLHMRLSRVGDDVTVYPAGAEMLDSALVNDNLRWLGDFPSSQKVFREALTMYMSGDRAKARNVADNLRVSIEQLLRGVLNNQKSLEKQSQELDRWLEAKGTHAELRQLFAQVLLGPYCTFQNDVAKHGVKELLPGELEFVIYQTGVFLRLIVQLAKGIR